MAKQYTKVVDWTTMPRIWWIPGDDVWYSEARRDGDAPYERVDTGEPMFWLPPDRAELKQVIVDELRGPREWTGDDDASENNRKLATELAEANARLKARIRRLEKTLPEVECPSCSAVIRARLADQ